MLKHEYSRLVALIINLEDLVVKQAHEQSGRVPTFLWLVKE